MLLTILLVYIAAVAADEIGINYIKINNTCHNVTNLLKLRAPFRSKVVIPKMGILRSKNVLFYSFEPNITDDEYYKVGFVNLDNPDDSGILSPIQKSIFNFGTFDIDQENQLVYLGGSDGIYVLDTKQKRLVSYSSRGDTILSMVFSNSVYFTVMGEDMIMRKNGDNFIPLLEYRPVKNFVITKYGHLIFLSNRGLFVTKDGEIVQLSKNAYFRGMTMDLEGVVYTWWIDDLYRVAIGDSLSGSRLVKIAEIPKIGAVTFDNGNNFLFTVDNTLFKLTNAETSDC